MVVGRVGIEQGGEIGRRKLIGGGIVKKVEARSKQSLINSCLGLFNLYSSVKKKQPNTTKLNRPPPPSLLPPKPKINPSSANLGNNPSGKGINHQKTMIINIPDDAVDETQPSVFSTTTKGTFNPEIDTHLPPPLGLEETHSKPIPVVLPSSPTSPQLFDLGGEILGTGEFDIDDLLFDINSDSYILDSTQACCSDESMWEAYLAALEEANPVPVDDDAHNDHGQRTVIIDISDDEEEEEEELEEEEEEGEGEEEEDDDLVMMINDSMENNMMIDNRDKFSLAYGDHMLPILSYC